MLPGEGLLHHFECHGSRVLKKKNIGELDTGMWRKLPAVTVCF